MQREDSTFRKRDKNQIKVVKKQSKNLKPSWQSKGNVSITDYHNLEIEGSSNQSDSSSTTNAIPNENDRTLFELDPGMEARMQAILAANSDADGEADHEGKFSLDETAEAKMQALLEAASSGEDATEVEPMEQGRVTRSSGLTLEWNPIMNDKDVIVKKD